jgi:hypothetical protein
LKDCCNYAYLCTSKWEEIVKKSRIKNLDDLRIAAEEAAEKVIFRHAYLISEEVQRKIWERGDPYAVLDGNEVVLLYPDGRREVIAQSTARRVKVPQKIVQLKRPT